jgi:endonuclease/exonuclease/phosphatase family metal-dependent hydrolase
MTLRVGTFNARFLPHLPSNGRRAEVLSDRIREGRYDLIALTEVFSARARRVLIERLADAYPWNVQYIGSRRIVREDSGLMVLSRLPFDVLPDALAYHHPRIRASASGVAPDWPHVRFVEYDDCSSSDCLAGKGAGYVRVRYAGRPLNVFFTHMQAAYDYHGPRKQARTRQVRSNQLHQLADLVRAALGTEGTATGDTLILGDLNVDGVRSPAAGTAPVADGSEWTEMLTLLGVLFPHGLTDVWDRHAPLGDLGHTFPAWDPIARRDYVLLSAGDHDPPLAVHHAALDWDLARPHNGTGHVSDHLGISVDLNPRQEGCHPLDAFPLGTIADRRVIDGYIRHRGGLQWYRLDHGATVDVELRFPGADAGTALEVFCARDISRPLRPEAGNGHDGRPDRRTYALASEALIRVGSTRSSLSGTYSLAVHPTS